MTYWILLKSGRLEIRVRQPKGRPYISEVATEVKADFQHYVHDLSLYDGRNSEPRNQRRLDTFCGYDRGPFRQAVIGAMFGKL